MFISEFGDEWNDIHCEEWLKCVCEWGETADDAFEDWHGYQEDDYDDEDEDEVCRQLKVNAGWWNARSPMIRLLTLP